MKKSKPGPPRAAVVSVTVGRSGERGFAVRVDAATLAALRELVYQTRIASGDYELDEAAMLTRLVKNAPSM